MMVGPPSDKIQMTVFLFLKEVFMWNPSQDWPVFIFMAVFIGFVIYAVINSNKNEKMEKEKQKKELESKK
ncbi:MAG: hypothetical protein A2297_09890 [Elusimicrobia bacterium RIFOXYB2_FULL_48_7]|nr:MAG: hypothetical protein A2297_09890 [Elusimicrobia bacterium RIFOXYB2_FULL_48_7]